MTSAVEQNSRSHRRRALGGAALAALLVAGALVEAPLSVRIADAGPAVAAADADGGSAAETPVSTRVALRAQFQQAMRAGNLDAAGAAANVYLKQFPFDGLMRYNLACVEARQGAREAALGALGQALASPLADPRQAEQDADLATLRGDPRFEQLVRDTRDRLRTTAREHHQELRDGAWSGDIELAPNDGSPQASDWPRVTIQLMSNSGGLQIRGTVSDLEFHDRRQPWRNGDGFRVTIGSPASATAVETDRSFGFGFGFENGLPVGALIEQDGRAQPTQVVELSPKIKLQEGGRQASYSVFIPWSAIAPYAPPVDSLLGINVSYLSVGDDQQRRTVSLVPDPALEIAGGPWRRCAPLAIKPSDQSTPVLRGAVANAVVGSGPLGIRFVAWLPRAGEATLRVEIQDVTGQSVVRSGEQESRVPAVAGINRWQRAADLSRLPTGPFRIQARLTPAGGDTLRWQTEVVRYDPGWRTDARARAGKLAEGDRPTIEYRLAAIDKELAGREARTPPEALATTLIETQLLLKRAEKTGTVLPDSGDVVCGYRDSTGTLKPCGVHVPRGFSASGPHRLFVLLPGTGPGAPFVARQLAIGMKPAPDLVVIWPQSPPDESVPIPGSPATAADVIAATRWARARFRATEVQLAGVGLGAADALEASLAKPSAFARVLLMAGTAGDLWPHETTAQEASRIAPRLNQLVYTVFEPGPTAPVSSSELLGKSLPAPGADARTPDTGAAGLAAALGSAGLCVDRRPQLGAELDVRSASDMLAEWAAEAPRPAAK
jgi:hypothetical protein